MNKLLIALLAASCYAIAPVSAEDGQAKAGTQAMSPFEKTVLRGQQAFEHGSIKSAITYWKKALGIAPEPKNSADVQTHIAEAFASQKKYSDANSYLDQALDAYSKLGGVSADFARVYADVTSKARSIPAHVFGESAEKKLNDCAAKVSMQQAELGGTHIDIVAPARFTTDVNGGGKIDQIGFEKAVSFDVVRDTVGNTVVSNIKGFRMHIPEKGMWVNLLNLVVKPADGTGNAPVEVTAGKAGITKTVESSLPPRAVAKIEALTKSAEEELGKPAMLTLPVLTP